jgi:hypothetical protein
MRVLVATISTVFLLLSACGRETSEERAAACEVAKFLVLDDLNHARSHSIVYSTAANDSVSNLPRGRWWGTSGHLINAPSSTLLSRLEKQDGENAVAACADVRKLLDERHIAYGAEAVDASVKNSPTGFFKKTIIYLSLPIVSADGREAIYLHSFQSGGRFGTGQVEYRKSDMRGGWVLVGSAELWVS